MDNIIPERIALGASDLRISHPGMGRVCAGGAAPPTEPPYRKLPEVPQTNPEECWAKPAIQFWDR